MTLEILVDGVIVAETNGDRNTYIEEAYAHVKYNPESREIEVAAKDLNLKTKRSKGVLDSHESECVFLTGCTHSPEANSWFKKINPKTRPHYTYEHELIVREV